MGVVVNITTVSASSKLATARMPAVSVSPCLLITNEVMPPNAAKAHIQVTSLLVRNRQQGRKMIKTRTRKKRTVLVRRDLRAASLLRNVLSAGASGMAVRLYHH